MKHLTEALEMRTLFSANFGVAIVNTYKDSGGTSHPISHTTAANTLDSSHLKAAAVRYWAETNFTSASSDDLSSTTISDLAYYHSKGIQTTLLVTLKTGSGNPTSTTESNMDMSAWLADQINTYANTATPLVGTNAIVDRWEIINEPDINTYWPQASSVTQTLTNYMNDALKPAYNTLHALGAKVIGGAMGSSANYDANDESILKTLGYANYVDYLNIHPYGLPTGTRTAVQNHEDHVSQFINDFTDAGASTTEKPLVATEWNYKPGSGTSDATWIAGLNAIEANDAPLFDTLYYYRFGDDGQSSNYDHKAGLVDPSTTTTDAGETIYSPNNPYYSEFKGWTNPTSPPPGGLTPTADTYAYSGNTTQTAGSDPQMEVKHSTSGTNDRQAFLKFDISSLPAGASDIVLHLHGQLSQAETGGLGLTVNQVSSTSWSESTLDWANKPTVGSQIGSSQTLNSTSDTELTFDVTSYVQTAIANGQTSVSIAVLPTSTATSAYAEFGAKEGTSADEPELTYTTSTTATPSADAYVFSGNTTQNTGSDNSLQVKKSFSGTTDRQAFLKFDISGISSSASSVYLNLVGNENTVENLAFSVFGVSDTTWGESTIDWANKPTIGSQIGSSQTVSSTTDSPFQFDITSYVLAQKALGKTSITLALEGTGSSTTAIASFHSREDGSSTEPTLTAT